MNKQKTWFQSIWYWRLGTFECGTDMYITAACVWLAAVADKDWDQLSPTARHVIWVSMSVAAIKVMKAWLSTTKQDLKDELPEQPGIQTVETLEVKTISDVKPATATTQQVQPIKNS